MGRITDNFKLLAVFFLAILFSTGNGLAGPPQSSVNDDGLPNYRPGTTFIYTDGNWENVLSATPVRVEWENQEGHRYSGPPDFTRRPEFWQGRDRQVRRTFGKRTDLLFKQPLSIWPLSARKKSAFEETGVWTDEDGAKSSYTAQWTCEVAGREQAAVPAGTFDTWRIDCRRYSVSSNLKSTLRQVDTWFYSREVGHYVLKESRYASGKPSARRELVAIMPPHDRMPPAARQRSDKSFQAALEKHNSGESVAWTSKRDQLSGATMPTDTFRMADGTYCRRYAQTINQLRSQHVYYGLACRSPNGIWSVPKR